MSSLQEAARQEAERRYPEREPAWADRGLVSPIVGDQRDAFEEGFEAGAAWAEQEAAAKARYLEGFLIDIRSYVDDQRSYEWPLWAAYGVKEIIERWLAAPEPGSTGQEDA